MLVYTCVQDFPVKTSEIQFGLLSPEEIRRISVVEITENVIYYRGLPFPNGILDHRMGTIDRRLACGTCMRDVKSCPGHSGHLELAFPVYHPGFIDIVLKILRSVCFLCSRITISREEIQNIPSNLSFRARFMYVYAILKLKKKCSNCGCTRPSYSRTLNGIKIDWPDMIWKSEAEKTYCTQYFSQRNALSILRYISNEDYTIMGFDPTKSHPSNMIMICLLVPPPVVRPAIMISEGSRSRGQDDLTRILQDINKKSNELKQTLQTHWSKITLDVDIIDKINKLQLDINAYIANNTKAKPVANRAATSSKSLTCRLKGKDGRIRGNLMGKRVDFSARSVITPDACMDVDQVGVPYKIGMCITYPERVTEHNIREMNVRVKNGSTNIIGAENIITMDGTMINLRFCKTRDNIRLQYGWIVERYLKDDDIVIFNRQPSLHKMGMMAHRVKLMPGLSFRMNLCCATPYNADFDGDEMNLHIPQSPAAVADAAVIMMVGRQIISPQANKPVMGIVQDTLIGSFLFTTDDVFLTFEETCRLVAHTKYITKKLPEPTIFYPQKLWCGKQIFSMLFPDSMQLKKESMLIQDGKLLYGTLKKIDLGTSNGGIIDILFREYGSTVTIRFMSDIQRLINPWLLLQSFSVGIGDCILESSAQDLVTNRINTAMSNIHDIVKEAQTGLYSTSQVEPTILRILSKTLMQTGSIVQENQTQTDGIKQMVAAGSKGNEINISQICGCVGQQSVEGKRIFPEKGSRTLPCFDHDDQSLASQGFVQNSYALGLHPYEYFFHAMGGREGLVDTAVKTATTGYIQRRQTKSMEDHKVFTDKTVRNADEGIIDFLYGGDGFDASRIERLDLPLLSKSNKDLEGCMLPDEVPNAIKLRDWLLKSKKDIMGVINTRVLSPFNPKRLLQNVLADTNPPLSLTELKDNLSEFMNKYDSITIKAILQWYFRANELHARKTSQTQLDFLFTRIKNQITHAYVHHGEMVGSLAAQSIGEPCTQLTLNTFHYAGCGSKNVTLGIPRLKELLDNSKNIKTPSNTIVFKPFIKNNKEIVELIANTLPFIKLDDIVQKCEIIYEPDHTITTIENDIDMVQMDNELELYDLSSEASKYIVRLEFIQPVMKKRNITPSCVADIISIHFGDKIHAISSQVNEIEWILRLRFDHIHAMKEHINASLERESMICHHLMGVLLTTIVISGHPTIKEAFLSQNDNTGEYIIETQGCAFDDLYTIPCVDWYNCYSNDIINIHNVLGIEATVSVLFNEIKTTISFDGTYVDARHIMMICNTMTNQGFIMPLSRHGINRMSTGPMLRCSFEETPDILCDAAMFAELDNGKGISNNIMTGQLSSIGSGSSEIKMNTTSTDPRLIQTKQRPKLAKSKIRSISKSDKDLSNNNHSNSDSVIFCNTEYDKPYCDDEPQKNLEYERTEEVPSYRPSSPDIFS